MPLAAPPPAFVAPGGRYEVVVDVAGDARSRLEIATARGTLVLGRRRGDGALGGPILAPGVRRLTLRVDGEPPKTLRVRVRPLRIVAVGDVSQGSSIDAVRAHGARWQWEVVGPLLRRQDLVVANLETAIGTSGEPWPDKLYHFLAPPSVLGPMREDGGVDVVSVANNHALDYGRATFLRGLRSIERAGLVAFGGGRDLAAATRPAIVEAGGLRIAFVGFDGIEPPGFIATADRAGLAPLDAATVARSVRAARTRADLVIAFMHWGTEYDPQPTAEQAALAAVARRAGARIVLGAHPHVLQPLARSRRDLVAYSLGNFVFQPGRPAGAITAALRLDVDARGAVGQRLLPVRIVGTRPVWR